LRQDSVLRLNIPDCHHCLAAHSRLACIGSVKLAGLDKVSISGMGRLIDLVLNSRVGFLGMADHMDLLLVRPNPRWQLATIFTV